jgi:sec-independent protein translocase protein TatB
VFDVGFSELMVIAVVALVVLGPERLPGVARTAGALLGRARRYVNELKADIQTEVDLEEFNRIKATFYDAAKSIEDSVSQAKDEIDATAQSLNQSIAAQFAPPAAATAGAPRAPAQLDFWLDSTPAAELSGTAANINTQAETHA